MITHYLKVAVRNLLKYKTQSVISILGLSIGIAFFIYGWHWLNYETSYDNFYPNAKRSYLVYIQDENNKAGYSPHILTNFIREYCPEAEIITHSYEGGEGNIDYLAEEKRIKNPDFMLVDSVFFDIFPQIILNGRKLMNDDEIIISESFAKEHYGSSEKALGNLLQETAPAGFYLADARTFQIVGIMEDAPQNSTLTPEGYYQQTFSTSSNIYEPKEWEHANGLTHVMLKEGYKGSDFEKHLNTSLDQLSFLKDKTFKVIPLNQKHFEFASEESFSYSAISMFTIATGLLLCCVLFNFMNLFLNRYYQRVREVKLRKSVGASHLKQIMQVMLEITTYCLIGFLFSGCIIELTLPFFEETFGLTIPKTLLWKEYTFVVVITLFTILFLLSIPAIQFIRSVGKLAHPQKGQNLQRNLIRRTGLVIQLVICLFFFASASSLYQQLRFMNNTDMGFDTPRIIELMVRSFEQNSKDMLKEIKQLPMIERHATTSQYMVSKEGFQTTTDIIWNGKREEDQNIQLAQIELTKEADKMFNFRLKKGRTYTDEDWTGSNQPKDFLTGLPVLNKVLLTESAVTAMHLEQPIGEIIRIPFSLVGQEPKYTDYEIIGVIKDFHPQGTKEKAVPTLIFQSFRFISPLNYFQVMPGTESQAIESINRLAEKHGWTYEGINAPPRLISDKMKELNKSETATFRLFTVLTSLCILISLFGIFSISASNITQRRKEIAVRKIMGATGGEVIRMFFREYSWLVSISAVIAFPFFYYTISRWLEQYAYHISISIGMYVALSGITILLVLLTVFRQVSLAANENPADVVKSE